MRLYYSLVWLDIHLVSTDSVVTGQTPDGTDGHEQIPALKCSARSLAAAVFSCCCVWVSSFLSSVTEKFLCLAEMR